VAAELAGPPQTPSSSARLKTVGRVISEAPPRASTPPRVGNDATAGADVGRGTDDVGRRDQRDAPH
jgi:hypothetical protein